MDDCGLIHVENDFLEAGSDADHHSFLGTWGVSSKTSRAVLELVCVTGH